MRRDEIVFTSSEDYINSIPTEKQLKLLEKLGYGDCSNWTRWHCRKVISEHLANDHSQTSSQLLLLLKLGYGYCYDYTKELAQKVISECLRDKSRNILYAPINCD